MATRDSALDLVKGLLVIGMLIIHTSNIFIENDALRALVYPWLMGFVSGSWVVISGFIIGAHYRLRFASSRLAVTRRLLDRGWRLVAIFAVTNVLLGKLALSCSVTPGLQNCDVIRVLVLGDHAGQTFEILLAIGYLLILSPVFLWWPRFSAWLTGVALILATVAAFADIAVPGVPRMLLYGAAGIVAGRIVTPGYMTSLLTEPRPRLLAAILAAGAWSGYLWQRAATGHSLIVLYLAYVMGALVMLYLATAWIEQRSLAGRQLAVMARYSLLAYMGQMGILQAMRWLMPDSPLLRSFPVAFCVALVVLLISLHVVDYLRRNYVLADKSYHAVFG